MIIGAHTIIHSTDAEADRAFLRDIFGLPHVDVGGGWLIFGLPPAEVAVHPADDDDANGTHQLFFMVHDVEALVAQLTSREIETTPVQDQGWGLVTEITLPGGSKLPIYQPRHERPEPMVATSKRKKAGSKKTLKKTVKKVAKKKATRAPAPVVAVAKKKAAKKKTGSRR